MPTDRLSHPDKRRDALCLEQNNAIVQRLFDEIMVADKKNMAVFDEVYNTNLIYHGTGELMNGDLNGLKQLVASIANAFPDFQGTLDDLIAEGDKVVYRWTFSGTHKAEFNGIPATGKRVTARALSVNRVAGGKIVEEWENLDELGILQQLGVVPSQ